MDDTTIDYSNCNIDSGSDRDLSLKRLQIIWNIIRTPYYMKKCKNAALKYGDGINIFRFLSYPNISSTSDIPNCEYYYADSRSDMWKILTSNINVSNFRAVHQYGVTFVVYVSIPVASHHDEYIQSIKLFSVDDDHEIEY